MTHKTLAAILAAFVAAAMLVACGGSSGGGGDGVTGINGTGYVRGPVQRFGSVFVGGREIDTSNAVFVIDDQPTGMQQDLAVGNVVEMNVQFHEDGRATATEVRFDAELEGPIDTIDKGPITPTGGGNHAFVVAGQTVFVSGTTFFEDVSGFAALQPGDVVEISGNIDANGILRASSVELQQNPVDPNNVELKGTVSILDINSKTFKINDLTVDYSAAALDPANFQPDNGQFVEVSGTLAGNSLTAHELELEDRAPVGAGDAAEIEGIVAAVDGAASTFTLVSGLQVAYGDARFEEGGPADIKTGAEVEVTGQVDASHVLQAIKIEVESDQDDPIVEVAAKVHTSASSQVTLFNGALEVQTTDDTRIKDDRDDMRTGFSVAELQPGDYVEIAATIGSGGELLATRIERDEPEDEVELKGPLASANEAARMIEILDVKVSFSAATEFEDANDNPTSEADFYAQANAGSLVKVEGRFNGNLIEAAEVSLEEDTPD